MKKKIYTRIVMAFVAGMLLLTGINFNVAKTSAATEGNKIEQIKKNKKLVVGTSPDYPPYEFIDVSNGKNNIVGFDIEIAKEIAKDLGVELELKEISFDGLLAALQAGSIDMVLAGMNANDERRKSVDFSDVYLKSATGILVKKENAEKYKTNEDLKTAKVGAQQASIQEEAAKSIVGEDNVRSLPKLNDLVLEVKNKNIDVLIVDKLIGAAFAKNDPSVVVPDMVVEEEREGVAAAIAKGNTDLVELTNSTLARLKSTGQIEKLFVEAQALADKQNDVAENGETPNFFEKTKQILSKYGSIIASGTLTTITISLLGVIIGALFGLLLALVRVRKIKVLTQIVGAYIELMRGTPLLVQIYIIFYGLPAIGVQLDPFNAGLIAISLNSAAYVAEIIRAGIDAVDNGQMEAARSLGLSYSKSMKLIIIPQAIKNILPALGNEFITIIKESSVVSVIGVGELMYNANIIRANTYEPFIPLIIATVIYFALTFTLSKGLGIIERNMKKNDIRN